MIRHVNGDDSTSRKPKKNYIRHPPTVTFDAVWVVTGRARENPFTGPVDAVWVRAGRTRENPFTGPVNAVWVVCVLRSGPIDENVLRKKHNELARYFLTSKKKNPKM